MSVTSACSPSHRPYVLAASVLGSSMAFIDGTAVTLALQPIQEGLGARLSDILWISNAYTLVLAAFILVGGSLGDRFGRRGVFMLGVGVFVFASLLCGLAPTSEILIAGRALQGLGAALLTPLSLALIAGAYPKEERGRAIGAWAAASAIMTAIGPPLGGFLAEAVSWRWIFFLNAPIGAAAILLSLWRTPAAKPEAPPEHIDLPGATLAVLALGAVAYGMIALSDVGAEGVAGEGDRAAAVAAILIGLAAAVGFVLQERRAPAPMAPPAVFQSAPFNVINVLTFLLYGAFGGMFVFYPIVLKEAYGHGVDEAGRAFLGFALSMGLLSRVAGGLIDRFGTRAMLGAGGAVATLGLAWIGLSPWADRIFAGAFLGMVVFGVGMAVVVPALSTAIFNTTADAHHGVASGVNNAVARAGTLFAVAGFGLIAARGFDAAAGPAARAVGYGAGGGLTGAELVDYQAAMTVSFTGVAIGAVLLAGLSALAAALFFREDDTARDT